MTSAARLRSIRNRALDPSETEVVSAVMEAVASSWLVLAMSVLDHWPSPRSLVALTWKSYDVSGSRLLASRLVTVVEVGVPQLASAVFLCRTE